MTRQTYDYELREAPEDGGEPDPLAEATRAVNDLREAAERRDREHREHVERIEREARERMDALETRLNRPGAGGTDRDQEAERRAFIGYCRHGEQRMSADELRALATSDDTSGGYIAPAQFVAELLKNLVEISPVRAAARVMNTGAGSVILPKRTGRISGGWTGELEESGETEPTYGQVEIPAEEMTAYVPVSNKLLEDNAVNLESELALDFAEEFGEMEGSAFVNGNGVKKPRGIMSHPDVGYTAGGSASALTADGLIDLFYAVKNAYRQRGVWMMNSTTVGAVRKLKDDDGRYLWKEPLSEAAPSTILGRPVVEAPDMDDVEANAFPIVFGDFNAAYRIVDRIALSILRDPYSQAKKGLVLFHARRRVGGDVVKAEAIRKLKVATS